MTCIAALVDDDGTIHMGGDTLASENSGGHVVGLADEKVFVIVPPAIVTGDFIVGFADSYRVGQLLRYSFTPPDVPRGRDDMAYMCTDFIDAWRALQAKKGTMKSTDGEESHSGLLLVGWRRTLYAIDDDFSVSRPTMGYYAIGAGAQFALGSLHTSGHPVYVDGAGYEPIEPQERIKRALEAASAFHGACRGPYTLLSLEP